MPTKQTYGKDKFWNHLASSIPQASSTFNPQVSKLPRVASFQTRGALIAKSYSNCNWVHHGCSKSRCRSSRSHFRGVTTSNGKKLHF